MTTVALSEQDLVQLRVISKTLGDAGGNQFRRSIASIYAVKENLKPTHLGSSTLLEIDGHCILLTAAHIVDEHVETSLYVAAGGMLMPLRGDFFVTQKLRGRALDHYDIAFTKLPPDLIEAFGDVFVPESGFCDPVACEPGRLFTAIGFPNSKNKNFDGKKLVVRAQDYSFTSVHKEVPWLSKKLTGNGEFHLQLMYDKRVRRESGVIDNAFFPRGLSGGPVVDCGRPSQVFLSQQPLVPKPLIAGITIELKHRRLIAVRMDAILPSIRRELAKVP
jgi:hypothetical protein